MYQLTPRCYTITQFLLAQDTPVAVKQIADEFNVSVRTVRYDLDQIEDYFNAKGVELKKKSKVGIWVEDKIQAREKLRINIDDAREYQNQVLSEKERISIMISTLLQNQDFVTFKYLAYITNVGRSTIIKDFTEVEEWFNKRNIKVIKKTKLGLKLACGESERRRGIVDYIYENFDENNIISFIEENNRKWLQKDRTKLFTQEYINSLLSEKGINVFQKYIRNIEMELGVKYSDSAFAGLLINFGIAIKRLNSDKTIFMPQAQLEDLKLKKEYVLAKKFSDELENEFKTKIPDSEIGYITLHLIGAKIRDNYKNDKTDEDPEISRIEEFIDKVSAILRTDLRNDLDLKKNLLIHIKPSINRLRYGMKISNPVLNDIKSTYPNLFNATKKAAKVLYNSLGLDANEDEIGYITMHVGAALERMKDTTNKNTYRALIVCASSIGTSKMLSSRLKTEFKQIEIVREVPLNELKKYIDDSIDIIISTIPIDGILLKPVVNVSPLLVNSDIAVINRALEGLKDFQYDPSGTAIGDDILKLIEKYCIITDRRGLVNSINNYFSHKKASVKIKEDLKLLSSMLCTKRIKLNIDLDNKEQVIDAAGRLLFDDKYIEERYIEAMQKLSRDYNSYIVIAPGIAMPHARPEDGAINAGFSLITLKRPVCFGHPQNDPVRLVIGLAAIDNYTHLKALSELSTFLNSEESLEKLFCAIDESEVMSIIKEFEKSFQQRLEDN